MSTQQTHSLAHTAPQPPPRPFARPRKRRRHPPPTVRANPPHYVTDLSPASTSPEARAAALLLSNSTRSVALHGLPGTGKTVALRAVAHHAPIAARFPDGIALLPLTPSTTPQALLRSLSAILSSVSTAPPPPPDPTQTALQTLSTLARALSTRRVLLLLDDATDHTATPPALSPLVLRLVATVSAPGAVAAVLAATRALDTARAISPRAALPVFPRASTGPTARAILCAHAGFELVKFDRLLTQTPGAPAATVLHKCAGLPLALAVAGGAVKRLLANATSVAVRNAIWEHYRVYLQSSFAQFGQISGLFRSLSELVAAVHLRGAVKWPGDGGVETSVAALGALGSAECVRYPVLASLWGVHLDNVAVMVAALAGRGLLILKNQASEHVVEIFPIVLDYCRFQAAKRPGFLETKTSLLLALSRTPPLGMPPLPKSMLLELPRSKTVRATPNKATGDREHSQRAVNGTSNTIQKTKNSHGTVPAGKKNLPNTRMAPPEEKPRSSTGSGVTSAVTSSQASRGPAQPNNQG